jgi:hypothetical protein
MFARSRRDSGAMGSAGANPTYNIAFRAREQPEKVFSAMASSDWNPKPKGPLRERAGTPSVGDLLEL